MREPVEVRISSSHFRGRPSRVRTFGRLVQGHSDLWQCWDGLSDLNLALSISLLPLCCSGGAHGGQGRLHGGGNI